MITEKQKKFLTKLKDLLEENNMEIEINDGRCTFVSISENSAHFCFVDHIYPDRIWDKLIELENPHNFMKTPPTKRCVNCYYLDNMTRKLPYEPPHCRNDDVIPPDDNPDWENSVCDKWKKKNMNN